MLDITFIFMKWPMEQVNEIKIKAERERDVGGMQH